ncbi:MAG: dienelactone hydrolase family protein [Croceibacterium sp.]
MKGIVAALLALSLPLESALAQAADKAEAHYYPRPTEAAGAAHPWLIMLPGGGGMDVFGDSHFYFDVAREWNKAGFDVLVIHYQAAAPLVKGAAQANPAEMEAAVVADALETAREKHWLDLQCPGMVMGFSLGGAGTLKLAAEPPKNLVGAIGFYPAVVGQSADYRAAVPVLALQGDSDQVTPRATLDTFVAKSKDPAKFTVVHYPGAYHGFDIPSLAKPQTYQGGTFQYQAAATKASDREVAAFRRARVAAAHAPAECKI